MGFIEKNMELMDELSGMYAKIGEHENKQACSMEADAVESEVLQAIEKAKCLLRMLCRLVNQSIVYYRFPLKRTQLVKTSQLSSIQ